MASASAASSERRVGLGQQHADHHAHLRLVAMAGADDALLHQVRRVFGDRHAGSRRHHHGDAARLAEFQRRLRVLVDEGLLRPRPRRAGIRRGCASARHGWREAAPPARRGRWSSPSRSRESQPLPAISTMPQPVRRSPGSMPRMRIGRFMAPIHSMTAMLKPGSPDGGTLIRQTRPYPSPKTHDTRSSLRAWRHGLFRRQRPHL